MSHLDGVLQYVLTVAGTVSHAPQQLDHIRVHTVNVGLQNRTLTVLLDFVFDFTLCFFYRFLDACPDGFFRPESGAPERCGQSHV